MQEITETKQAEVVVDVVTPTVVAAIKANVRLSEACYPACAVVVAA